MTRNTKLIELINKGNNNGIYQSGSNLQADGDVLFEDADFIY